MLLRGTTVVFARLSHDTVHFFNRIWEVFAPTRKSIMDPRSTAGGADKERVVVRHGQIVDRRAADAPTRRKLCGRIPLPGNIGDRHQRPGAGDDAVSNPQAPRFHPA